MAKVVTVFRSRVRKEVLGEYAPLAARHAEHSEAKKKGRSSFYSEYKIQICAVQRENEFRR